MNLKSALNAATMGNPRQLRPMIWWTILEYAMRGAPYGLLLFVIWELFKPLQSPGSELALGRIALACAGMVIALGILYWANQKSYFAAYKDSYELCAKGRLAIAEHLRRLPMGFFNTRDPGDIGAYLITDYNNIEHMISHLVPQVIGGLAMPLVLIISLSFINWQLALAAALVIPLAWPLSWATNKLVRWMGKKHQKVKVTADARMLEYIQGIKLIKAFNLGGVRFTRLEKAFRKLKNESIKLEAAPSPTVLLATFLLHSGLVIIIITGLALVDAGALSLPFYIMFLILGARVYEPLTQAFIFIGELNYMQLGVERLESLRKVKPLPEGQEEMNSNNYDIEFRDVSFRYHDTTVLDRIAVTLPGKSLTALVGPSGSGKTTVTRLIARFWDPDQGSLFIGGKDIRQFPADHLLSNISMVFQDVYLFHDTVLNNLRIGRPEAGREEIIKIAKQACCHDFVSNLPNGYDTVIGEGGNTLSGGEKQRLSIARAILKDAPIVLLDEATASLDPENELNIQQAINALVKNKTVVVIAHRLHTVIHADKIVVIDKGRVVGEGTHEELLNRQGLYRELWDEQERVKGWKF